MAVENDNWRQLADSSSEGSVFKVIDSVDPQDIGETIIFEGFKEWDLGDGYSFTILQSPDEDRVGGNFIIDNFSFKMQIQPVVAWWK